MTTMKITKLNTDDAILTEIGKRIVKRRLERRLTQAEAAGQAGVAKRTLERIEAGASAQMSSFLRILRVLDLLENLGHAIPEDKPGPMELLKQERRIKRRASKSRRQGAPGKSWTWNETT